MCVNNLPRVVTWKSSRLGMKKSGIFHQWLMAIGQKLNKVRSIARDNRVLL